MRYLFVMAHPDDEADVGGTIYTLIKKGENVAVAILVGKVAARRSLSNTLSQEEKYSMNILGVQKVYHADFPNIKMNIVPFQDLVRFIEFCIEDWQADAIVTHHLTDVNIDHVLTSKATMASCKSFQCRGGIPRLCLVLLSETIGATEWALDSSKRRFTPNYYVKIGKEGLEKKICAHEAYKGVVRLYPHPQSYEVYEGLAYFRGAQSGVDYAEAYECVFRSE